MKPISIFSILFLFVAHLSFGQSVDAFKKSALNAHASDDHATAYVHSRVVLEEEPNNFEFLKIAAESALEVYAYSEAETYLNRLETLEEYPLLHFYLGKLHHRQGHYDQAVEHYQKFLSYNSANAQVERYYIELAEQKITECSTDRQDLLEPSPGVTVEKAGGGMNTPWSDFVIPVSGDSIYLSSLEPEEDCKCEKPCQDQMQLYRTADYSTKTKVVFPESYKNVGHVTYGNDGRRMYFTQCICEEEVYTCELYYRDRDGYKGEWGPATKLPATINQLESTVIQPYIVDTETNEGRLYYVTDHAGEGARGGLDIWYVDVNGNEFGAPVNMAAINTSGDEVTPFYHTPTGLFYFSSNGRDGLGGFDFDVYQMSMTEGYAGAPTNMGAPINSIYDDLSFSLTKTGEEGYVSSNRDDGYTSYGDTDLQHCCPDIYKIEIARKNLIVTVNCECTAYGGYTQEPINGVDLQVSTEEEQLVADMTEGHQFTYLGIPTAGNLTILAEMDGYHPATITIDPQENMEENIEVELLLEPMVRLELLVKDKNNPELDLLINDIMLIDSTGEGYTIELERDGYSNLYTYELKGCHDYVIDPVCSSIDDKRYRFDTVDARIRFSTTCTPETIRKTIYMEIPQLDTLALTEPLPLYFDHAIPRREASRYEAEGDYDFYFNQYLEKKEDFLAFQECNYNPSDVEEFFEEIIINRQSLDTFANMLLNRLVIGDSAIIAIKGVASKSGGRRGYSNEDLSERRIDSMKKYLDNFFRSSSYTGSGNLIGRVKFIPEPVGDSIASEDAPRTGPCRIYSVIASRDRRIEITSIIFNPGDPEDDPCVTQTYNSY